MLEVLKVVGVNGCLGDYGYWLGGVVVCSDGERYFIFLFIMCFGCFYVYCLLIGVVFLEFCKQCMFLKEVFGYIFVFLYFKQAINVEVGLDVKVIVCFVVQYFVEMQFFYLSQCFVGQFYLFEVLLMVGQRLILKKGNGGNGLRCSYSWIVLMCIIVVIGVIVVFVLKKFVCVKLRLNIGLLRYLNIRMLCYGVVFCIFVKKLKIMKI